MQPDNKARLNKIRTQLANASPELKAELEARGMIATVEGRTLSLYNSYMVYLQNGKGPTPTIVGGYRQWLKAGRQVIKGQHGYSILFPVGDKDKDTGDILEANHFYAGTVFDISQTEAVEVPALVS